MLWPALGDRRDLEVRAVCGGGLIGQQCGRTAPRRLQLGAQLFAGAVQGVAELRPLTSESRDWAFRGGVSRHAGR